MAVLCIFDSNVYGSGQRGYIKAQANAAVVDIVSDFGSHPVSEIDGLYQMARSVGRMSGHTHIEVGVSIEHGDLSFGDCPYVSAPYILNFLSDTGYNEPNVTTVNEFLAAFASYRQQLPDLISRALKMQMKLGMDLWNKEELPAQKMAKIGRTLGKTLENNSNPNAPVYYSYDDERALWIAPNNPLAYRPRGDTGDPDPQCVIRLS